MRGTRHLSLINSLLFGQIVLHDPVGTGEAFASVPGKDQCLPIAAPVEETRRVIIQPPQVNRLASLRRDHPKLSSSGAEFVHRETDQRRSFLDELLELGVRFQPDGHELIGLVGHPHKVAVDIEFLPVHFHAVAELNFLQTKQG